MITKKQELLYHLARVAFNAGSKTPWYIAVHAIRQGLAIEDHKLDELDFQDYPELKELIERLAKAMNHEV